MKDIYQMEKEKLKGTLKCPVCDKFLSVSQILENSSTSWPDYMWILFKCPVCNKYSHVEIDTDKVSTGVLDGAPGPCFFICSEIELDGFDVFASSDFIECIYNGERYRFYSKN